MVFCRYFFIVIFFIFITSVSAQNKLELTTPLIFKLEGFNSGYELKLFNNNQFKYTSTFYSCFAEIDKNGKLKSDVSYTYADGQYEIKDNKLFLNIRSSSGYNLLKKEYYFLILDKKTFLISDKDQVNLKEVRKRLPNKAFPNYIINTDKRKEYTFFYTNQKVNLIGYEKDIVYKLFK